MDYSLLVAVENKPSNYLRRFVNRLINPLSTSLSDRGKLVCIGSDGCIYHFGIIDFLQKYTIRKWLETFIKGLFSDARKISCVHPKFYARRMLQFIGAWIA
jgi:Phosphatidylinositol-4-phosphate 5-Kinase